MRVGKRVLTRTAMALAVLLLSTTVAASEGPAEPDELAVRVLFLNKLGARSAQKLLLAEGALRIATYDPGRAIVVAGEPGRVDELEAVLRKSDPGLLSRNPHDPLHAVEGSPEIERTLATTDAKSGTVVLRAIYGMASLEAARDGLSLKVRDTAEHLDAAESLLRLLGLLGAS